jgi:hypothetical protein
VGGQFEGDGENATTYSTALHAASVGRTRPGYRGDEGRSIMAWCDYCGIGFAGDGGTCPTCGNKVDYSPPTALTAAEEVPLPEPVKQSGGFNFTRLCALGFWVASFYFGSFGHDGATASMCLIGAIIFTFWAMVDPR